jgi:glycosyltransferase involved in cell wall biosynthesis
VPPRILINTLSLTHGGGRSYVVNLLRELARDPRGFDFTVVAAADQLSLEETSGMRAVWVRLPATGSALRVVLRVLYEELVLPIQAGRYDLLYCVADLAPAVQWTPTVVALRNLNIYDRRFYDDLRLRVLERLVRLGIPRARRVIFPSRAAAEIITQRIPVQSERIAVIPHGISAEAFRGGAEPPVDAPPYLFLPASLERHKNISVLIECLPLLANPRTEAWIAGGSELDPGCAEELRRSVERLGLGHRVRFLGRVPYSEILGYFRGALALVFPSLIETFGHPLLEAMLAGTPIVAADIASFHEVAGDAALYFPPDDPVRLASLVDGLQADPAAARERVERGRARAREFTWSASVDRLCALFEEVLGARGKAAAARLEGIAEEPR